LQPILEEDFGITPGQETIQTSMTLPEPLTSFEEPPLDIARRILQYVTLVYNYMYTTLSYLFVRI